MSAGATNAMPAQWAVVVTVTGLLASGPLSAETGYGTYVNDRFGVTADVPTDFSVRDTPPANSDGQRFRTRDGGAELAIFGMFNVEHTTPSQMMATRRDPGTAYRYARATASWYALSGRRNGRITYERCANSTVTSDIVGCVSLEYPSSESRDWDPVVVRVSRSLRFEKPW